MAARVPSRLARRRGDVWRIPLPFRVLASASRLARGSPGLPPIPQGLQRLATPSRLAPGPRALPPAAPGPAPRAARPAGPSPASSPSAAPDRSQGAACAMHGPRVDAAHAGTRPSHRSAAGRPLAHRARTSGDTPNTGASSARPDDRPGDRPVLPAHARGPGWVIFGEQTRVYSRERRRAAHASQTFTAVWRHRALVAALPPRASQGWEDRQTRPALLRRVESNRAVACMCRRGKRAVKRELGRVMTDRWRRRACWWRPKRFHTWRHVGARRPATKRFPRCQDDGGFALVPWVRPTLLGVSSKGMKADSLATLESRMASLLVEVEGQYPRPWMTSMTDLTAAQVFIVGHNQAKTFRADDVTHQRYLDALFNRDGQTCRGLYNELTGGKPSPTRRNLDVLATDLSFAGVVETNVICFSTARSSELRRHPRGANQGAQIFKTLLSAIRSRVMIMYSQQALERASKSIAGLPALTIPENPAGIQTWIARIAPMGEEFEVAVIALPSLSPPPFNAWQGWWPEARARLIPLVREVCQAR